MKNIQILFQQKMLMIKKVNLKVNQESREKNQENHKELLALKKRQKEMNAKLILKKKLQYMKLNLQIVKFKKQLKL